MNGVQGALYFKLPESSQISKFLPPIIVVDAKLTVVALLHPEKIPIARAPLVENRALQDFVPIAFVDQLQPFLDRALTGSSAQSFHFLCSRTGVEVVVELAELDSSSRGTKTNPPTDESVQAGQMAGTVALVFTSINPREITAPPVPNAHTSHAQSVERNAKSPLEQLNRARDDVENFFASTDAAIIYVGNNLEVRRGSSRGIRLLNLKRQHFGKSIADVPGPVAEGLSLDCQRVIEERKALHREVNLAGGRSFIRQVSPYRTFENEVDGAIIIFHDITQTKRLSRRAESRERQQGMVAKLSIFALAGADPEALIQRAARMIIQVLNVDFVTVFKRLTSDDQLSAFATASVREDLPRGEYYEALAAYTLAKREAVIVDDLASEVRFTYQARSNKAVGSAISCLINGVESPFGVITVHSEEKNTFSVDDVNFILSLANIFSSALRLRKSQDVLHDSELQFRSLANSIPQIAWMADASGHVNWFNQRWYDYTGAGLNGAKGWRWRDIHHPDHIHRVVRKYQRCIKAGKIWEDEFPLRSKSGEFRWFLSRAEPILNQQNQVVRWFGTNTDITEKLEQAEALKRSESKLRMAMRTSRIGSFEYDVATGSIEWDDLLREIWGLPSHIRPSLERFLERLHPEDRSATQEAIGVSLDPKGGREYHAVYRVINAVTGAEKWLEASGQVLFDANVPKKMIGMAIDISERKKLEDSLRQAVKELQAADQSKNEFLSILGHELRNPLAALLNSLEVLAAENPEQPDLFKVMEHSVDTMSRLLDDLLDLNRVSQNRIRLNMASTDLNQVLIHAADVARGSCVRKRQTLLLDASEAMVVRGDASRLEQVFTNIILNASRYTPAGGRISVKAFRCEQDFEVHITDSGVGIAPEFLEKVFDPFFQIKQSGQAAAGLGIGLALSKKLTQLHGGKVEARSEGLNRGAEFIVSIPVSDGVIPTPQKPERRAPEGIRPGLRVLVVEDNQNILATIPVLLEHLGCEVKVAETGRAALSRAASFAPQAMLVDIGLPDISGHEVAKTLRVQGYRGLMVAVSGYSHKEMRDQSKTFGFDHHLAKPVTLAEIAELLATAPAS